MHSPGRSIRCSRCGASIELHAVALTAPCSSCGHSEPVPPELVEELRRYEGQHAASLEGANASLQKAQSMENLAARMPSSNATFKLFGIMLAFALAVGGGVQFMLMNPSFSDETKHNAMMLLPGMLMAFWLGIPVYLMLRRSRRKASQLSAAAVHVACPTCGANNSLVAGKSAAACSYCASRLVPSPTAVMRVLDASALAQRKAGMTAMRAQRAVTLRVRKASVDPSKMVFGSFGMVTILGLGSFLVGSFIEGDVRTAAILSLVMSALALPVLFFFLWRHGRRERWTSPLLDLAHQFGGRYSTKLDDQVAWLNTYWAMSYSDYCIVGIGLRFGTLAAGVAGYPTLLDLHPEKPYGSARYAKSFRPRLNILVGAHVPVESHSLRRLPEDARVHADAIRNMGFALSLSTSGILAEADGDLIKRFSKQPEDLHLLAQTLQSLTNLAAYLGPPASPIP